MPEMAPDCSWLSTCTAHFSPCHSTQNGAWCGTGGIWAVKSLLFLSHCLGSATLSLFVVRSNKSARWAILFFDSPPDQLMNSRSHLVLGIAVITNSCLLLRYRVTATTFLCLPMSMSLQRPLCCWPVFFYFLKSVLFASLWLITLHQFKPVLTLFRHLANPYQVICITIYMRQLDDL